MLGWQSLGTVRGSLVFVVENAEPTKGRPVVIDLHLSILGVTSRIYLADILVDVEGGRPSSMVVQILQILAQLLYERKLTS